MAFSRLVQVNLTVGAETTPTTLASSVIYDGETYTLDGEHPVGVFADGRPFIVSDGAGQITNTSTPSATVNGHVGWGMMKNPWCNGGVQGFDGFLGDFPTKTTAELAYSAAANVDPGASNAASWSAGEKCSFVKAFRDPAKTSTSGWAHIEKYHVITVLDAAPPAGTVAPGPAGTAKILRGRADVDFAPRGFSLPASFPAVSTILANIPDDLGFYAVGEQLRIFRTDTSIGTTDDGYSGEIIEEYAQFLYAVNSSDVSEAERTAMIDKVLFFANQVEAVLDLGNTFETVKAGQGGGLWLWVMAAAALTKDAALMAKCRAGLMQPDVSPLWVTAGKVGVPAEGVSGVAGQTYFNEHVGDPWIEPDEVTSSHSGRYVQIAAHICAWEYTAILAFDQGPAGYANGAAMILNGGANDATNDYAAGLNWSARYRQWSQDVQNSYSPTTAWKDAWDQAVAWGDFTPWTGKPDQPPTGASGAWQDPYFSAGTGSITLDTKGVGFNTETVTQTDFRYSLDGVQWITESNVTLSGNTYTKTGLLRGVAHYAGWRRHSASGASPWSQNHPYATPLTSGSDRAVVTTTGTETNTAPVNAVAPTIHKRPYPAWSYPIYEEAPATLGVNDVVLTAGVGYWTGYPAPTFTYQWKRGGGNIGGATSATYTRTVDDASASLTCEITATNSEGSASVTTAAVTAPAITTLPATKLIDTDFQGAFAIDYAGELENVVAVNGTPSHNPGAILSKPDGSGSRGELRVTYTASRPEMELPLKNAAIAGKTYAVTATLHNRVDLQHAMQFDIRNGADVSVLDGGMLSGLTELVEEISATITVAPGETDLDFRAWVKSDTSTGGASAAFGGLVIEER